MAKRKYLFDEQKIERCLKEGRGSGTGKDYLPWITVHDAPSSGRCSRPRGWKSDRPHHLLSDLELRYFYALEWADSVSDIREHFPIPRNDAQSIADGLHIPYPVEPTTRTPVVMTTDFVITRNLDGAIHYLAREVLPSDSLNDKRTIEKLQIRRAYWDSKGVDWAVVTEKDLPEKLIQNIQWVHPLFYLDGMEEPVAGYFNAMADVIRNQVSYTKNGELGEFCLRMEEAHQMDAGTCLMLIRHLLARKDLRSDFNCPISVRTDMSAFTVRPVKHMTSLYEAAS